MSTSGPIFENSWFRSSAIRIWTRKLKPLCEMPLMVAEIGCFQGQSSHWLCEELLLHPHSHLYAIDPWLATRKIPQEGMDRNYELYQQNLKKHIDAGRVTVYREKSEDRLPKFPDNLFDILYVDGGHDRREVGIDAEIGWTKIKPGGIIIFDDYRALRTSDGVTQIVNEWFLKDGHRFECDHFFESSKQNAFRKPVKPGDVPSVIADYTLANLHAKPNERPGAADAPGPGGV